MADEKHEPPTLSTFGDLACRGWRLDAWCQPCDRNVQIDLFAMPQDKPYMTTPLTCRVCGSRAEIRIGGPSKLKGQSRPA